MPQDDAFTRVEGSAFSFEVPEDGALGAFLIRARVDHTPATCGRADWSGSTTARLVQLAGPEPLNVTGELRVDGDAPQDVQLLVSDGRRFVRAGTYRFAWEQSTHTGLAWDSYWSTQTSCPNQTVGTTSDREAIVEILGITLAGG